MDFNRVFRAKQGTFDRLIFTLKNKIFIKKKNTDFRPRILSRNFLTNRKNFRKKIKKRIWKRFNKNNIKLALYNKSLSILLRTKILNKKVN